jgi:hypothetical protein
MCVNIVCGEMKVYRNKPYCSEALIGEHTYCKHPCVPGFVAIA